jgi:hypothetical protein
VPHGGSADRSARRAIGATRSLPVAQPMRARRTTRCCSSRPHDALPGGRHCLAEHLLAARPHRAARSTGPSRSPHSRQPGAAFTRTDPRPFVVPFDVHGPWPSSAMWSSGNPPRSASARPSRVEGTAWSSAGARGTARPSRAEGRTARPSGARTYGSSLAAARNTWPSSGSCGARAASPGRSRGPRAVLPLASRRRRPLGRPSHVGWVGLPADPSSALR